MCLSRAEHGGSLHVDCLGAEGIAQFALLIRARDRSEAHQHTVAFVQGNTTAIACIDHPSGMYYFPDFRLRIERSGKADGVHDLGTEKSDDGFRRASGGHGSDSAADQHNIILFEESEAASVVIPLAHAPIFHQGTHFALQGSDDRDASLPRLRHIRSPGTTRPHGAVHYRLTQSSSPARARIWQSWQTSSSCPCEQYRWLRADFRRASGQ